MIPSLDMSTLGPRQRLPFERLVVSVDRALHTVREQKGGVDFDIWAPSHFVFAPDVRAAQVTVWEDTLRYCEETYGSLNARNRGEWFSHLSAAFEEIVGLIPRRGEGGTR